MSCDWAGAASPDAQLLQLLTALFNSEQTDAALSFFELLQKTGRGNSGEDAGEGAGEGGSGVSRALMIATLEGVVNDSRGSAKAIAAGSNGGHSSLLPICRLSTPTLALSLQLSY